MTLNKELFVDDPTAKNIPNLGVTKVGEPEDAAAWDVLRYELKSFVCEGSYEQGLDRILKSFLAQAGGTQTAAWVSGFYAFALAMWAMAAWMTGVGAIGMLALAGAAAHMAWQLITLDISDPANCLRRFKSNRDLGWLIFAGFLADMAFAAASAG